MLTIACVLKSGGEFKPQHVYTLREGVARNLSLKHKFVCLTDMGVDCETLTLQHGWPGWFSKLELCDGRLTGDVFYLDLDSTITGSLDDLVTGHRFTVLENFWAFEHRDPDRIGSGLMAWNTDLTAIYRAFVKNADRYLREYRTTAKFGDQAFIKDHSPVPMERWQRKFPGRVLSFRKHVLPLKRVPDSASVVCFGGKCRPWNLEPDQCAWFDKLRESA